MSKKKSKKKNQILIKLLENLRACLIPIFENINNNILIFFENYSCHLNLVFSCIFQDVSAQKKTMLIKCVISVFLIVFIYIHRNQT